MKFFKKKALIKKLKDQYREEADKIFKSGMAMGREHKSQGYANPSNFKYAYGAFNNLIAIDKALSKLGVYGVECRIVHRVIRK